MICYEGGAEQDIDVPTGSTGIKADFAYSGGITKIGFKYGDWEATVNENGATITITSAVVKANSTGEVVELAFADLNDDTKDEANKAITLERYNSAPSWTFNPALSSGDYEKLVVTFAEAIPEEGLTITLNGETFAGLVSGATKATAYFTSGVSIESIGFSYGWNSKQGDTDDAPTATLKIAKVEMVKKSSSGSTSDSSALNNAITVSNATIESNVQKVEGENVTQTLTITAQKDAQVTLTISPTEGYELISLTMKYEETGNTTNSDGAGWSRTRSPVVGSRNVVNLTISNNQATFTMPASGVAIVTATFEESASEPVEPVTHILTVSKEWVTFCSPMTFAVPDGLNAYIVTAVTKPDNGETGTIALKEQNYVVANTPMLLKKTGTAESFEVTETVGQVEVDGTPISQYKGITTATDILAGSYVLINGTFLLTEGGTLAAYNCYLDFASTSNARKYSIAIGNDTTAIKSIGAASLGDSQWYDLQGRQVAKPQKGIYVKDGRKVIVK